MLFCLSFSLATWMSYEWMGSRGGVWHRVVIPLTSSSPVLALNSELWALSWQLTLFCFIGLFIYLVTHQLSGWCHLPSLIPRRAQHIRAVLAKDLNVLRRTGTKVHLVQAEVGFHRRHVDAHGFMKVSDLDPDDERCLTVKVSLNLTWLQLSSG